MRNETAGKPAASNDRDECHKHKGEKRTQQKILYALGYYLCKIWKRLKTTLVENRNAEI